MSKQLSNLKKIFVGCLGVIIIAGCLGALLWTKERTKSNIGSKASKFSKTTIQDRNLIVNTDFPHYKIFKDLLVEKTDLKNNILKEIKDLSSEDAEVTRTYINDIVEILAMIAYKEIFINHNVSYNYRTSVKNKTLKFFDIRVATVEMARTVIPEILDHCHKNNTLICTYCDMQQVIVLNLNGFKLHRLSPALRLFKETIGIVLSDCDLGNILEDLLCMKRLMWIIADNNNITTVPNLSSLECLRFISLIGNNINNINTNWLESQENIEIFLFPKNGGNLPKDIRDLAEMYKNKLFITKTCIREDSLARFLYDR